MTCRNIFFHLICCSLLSLFLKPCLQRSNSDLFNIPGYHFISNSREHKLGGEVGVYIQSDMNFKPRIDLQSSDNSLYESVLVEIMRPHGKNIIVGCLYRPPDASLNDFNGSVEDTLSAISFENKLSYIMIDFNINILNSSSSIWLQTTSLYRELWLS